MRLNVIYMPIFSHIKVFGNRILRRIFGPRGLSMGTERRLHNVEFHRFYRLANIVRVIKSRRLNGQGR
jgi:hypothetical protein